MGCFQDCLDFVDNETAEFKGFAAGRRMYRARTVEVDVPRTRQRGSLRIQSGRKKRIRDSVVETVRPHMGHSDKVLAGFMFHDADG